MRKLRQLFFLTIGYLTTELWGGPVLHGADLVVPEDVVFEADVEYSNPDGQPLQLDLARPKKGKGPFPAVLCIHGGGFRAGRRQGYDELCIGLAREGYVAATVTYRLAPRHQFPAAVHDVKAAVRWLRAHAGEYRIDPERIGVTGDSAGGHLAQFLGVTGDVREFEGSGGNGGYSSRVQCVVNYYGPSDLTQSYGKSVDAAEVLPLFLGGNLDQERRRHILASPLYWVSPDDAPTLCLHGTEDPYVAFEQAEWLVERLHAATVEAKLLRFEGAGHGFKGITRREAETARLAFFNRHLSKPTPVTAKGLPASDLVQMAKLLEVPNYCEGIVFDHEGRGYISHKDRITQFDPDGASRVWAVTGAPNGHKVLADGTHLVCDASHPAVLHLDAGGKVLGAASSECEGKPLRGPNDLTLDPAGGFYFSDPGGSGIRKRIGTVHYVDPDGMTHLVDDGLAFPNGIVLVPGGKRLLLAESQRNRVLEYTLEAPGKASARRVFADLPAKEAGQIDNQPDGMCLDAAGNLYVAHYGMKQVQVLDPNGQLVARYQGGNLTTSNVAFGGPDGKQLFITGGLGPETATGGLFRLDVGVPGLKILPPRRP